MEDPFKDKPKEPVIPPPVDPVNLRDLDLTQALVNQLQTLQTLQAAVMAEKDAPANQKAQVANALSASLANLVKVQETVYTSERLKRLEAVLLDCIKHLPADVQEAFLTKYEEALGT